MEEMPVRATFLSTCPLTCQRPYVWITDMSFHRVYFLSTVSSGEKKNRYVWDAFRTIRFAQTCLTLFTHFSQFKKRKHRITLAARVRFRPRRMLRMSRIFIYKNNQSFWYIRLWINLQRIRIQTTRHHDHKRQNRERQCDQQSDRSTASLHHWC